MASTAGSNRRRRSPSPPRHDGQERRGGVRSVVQVLCERSRAAAAAAHQADGIDVEQQRRGAQLVAGRCVVVNVSSIRSGR